MGHSGQYWRRSKLYGCAEWKEEAKTWLQKQKHTTGGIPRWSPTLVLVARFSAYVWQSGRDAQFSLTYGRMCLLPAVKLYRYLK